MWLKDLFENITAKFQASQTSILNQKKCEEFAADAYKYCTALYGAPDDPNKPYDLIKGIGEESSCSYALGRYTITLSPELETVEHQCMVIGHEMYHRFTMHRRGLRRQVWVDELLAFLTSYWFLRRHGFLECADSFIEGYSNVPGKIELKRLRDFHHQPWYVRLKNLGPKYPEDFYTEIAMLAVALMRIVSGNELLRIIQAGKVEEWIALLPEEKQYAVCRILEVSSDGKKPPEDHANLVQFFRALKAKGDCETAVAEFQTLAGFQPTNGTVFFYLAHAYEYAKEADAALDTYLKAFALGFTDFWLPSNVGKIYYRKKEYATAIEWFQKSIESNPDWATGYYFLGRSLNSLGKVGEAHKAWEKVLTLDNEKFKTFARQAIEENPLLVGEDAPTTTPESIPTG